MVDQPRIRRQAAGWATSWTRPEDARTSDEAPQIVAEARQIGQGSLQLLFDIERAVIRGWSAAAVDNETARSIINRLAGLELSPVADDIALLLAEGGRTEATPTEWHRIPEARDLAAEVWARIDSSPPLLDADDYLGRAINNPAGWLAQF